MANVLSADDMLRRSASMGRWRLPLVCLMAVLVVVAIRLFWHGNELVTSLGDTDDATRLVELYDYLQHGRWWDLTLDRIGAPDPLVSHWSRLIDLGLAVTLGAARLILSPPHAELAMRIVWPSLLLLVAMLVVARDVERDGGPWAAFAVIGLIVTSQTALFQFNVGRIDHHNVQILCGVGGILLLARSIVEPRKGWWAGALISIGLTVGLESATLVGPVIVVAVLLGLGRERGLDGQMRAAVTMAATLAVGAFLSIEPARWGIMVCDAVSFNLVALTAFGAAGVVAAAMAARRLSGRRLVAVQLVLLATGGVLGLAIYGVLEPRCLAGPFGQVAPEAWPVWLSKVTEAQPIAYLYRLSPGAVVGFLAMLGLGLLARLRLAYVEGKARGESDGFYRQMMLLAGQTLALAVACWQVKMTPYAAWLALPALAVVIASLPGTVSIGAPVVRLAAVILASQGTLMASAAGALAVVGVHGTAKSPKRTACSDTATISALANLPPGLVLADLDLGPYVVALTPHRVVMAPYHRLDHSIVTGLRLLEESPGAAEAELRRLGVTYVIACEAPKKSAGGQTASPAREGLEDAVVSGKVPAYLARVPLPEAPALRVYRVLPSRG
jgi:hypothetical protein